MNDPVAEAVERRDRAWREPAVPDDVEGKVHQPAHEVAEKWHRCRPPANQQQGREQLVGMQGQDDTLRASLHVVAQEGARCETSSALEEDIVDDVIDVDEKAARRHRGGEGP
jgi:hypothetical protein